MCPCVTWAGGGGVGWEMEDKVIGAYLFGHVGVGEIWVAVADSSGYGGLGEDVVVIGYEGFG